MKLIARMIVKKHPKGNYTDVFSCEAFLIWFTGSLRRLCFVTKVLNGVQNLAYKPAHVDKPFLKKNNIVPLCKFLPI